MLKNFLQFYGGYADQCSKYIYPTIIFMSLTVSSVKFTATDQVKISLASN